MPEYLLYVKEDNRTRQAYITPCFEIDKHFWAQEDGRRLHIIGRSPSLAIAFMLREQVNQRLAHTRMNEDGINTLKQLAHTSVRESTALYGRAVGEAGDWFSFVSDGGFEKERSLSCGSEKLAVEAGKLLRILRGRALLWEEVKSLWQQNNGVERVLMQLIQWATLQEKATLLPGIRFILKKGWWRHQLVAVCERCGAEQSIHLSFCFRCEQGCAYCPACIRIGQSRCCTAFLCVPGDNRLSPDTHHHTSTPISSAPELGRISPSAILQWDGTYTPWQKEAAERARLFAISRNEKHHSFLLWAVCGAGKTELLFPAIADMVSSGRKVLVATPRKDVVLELAPRLQCVFPRSKVIAVHGSSREKWEDADIVVSTTHQVIRFYRRFPLVVVDEADAFPYHGNPMLYRAVQRAVARGGKQLYLTATPPKKLRKSLIGSWRGRFSLHSKTHALLPQRYHGHPLPIPVQQVVPGLQRKIRLQQPLPAMLERIRESLAQGRRVFLFVPRVVDVGAVVQYLQQFIPEYGDRIAGVHAADPDRDEKVMMFRKKELALLVTTTILERGVTIPESDVIVWGADNPVFDQASLVQIAGRVGRSAESPGGLVLFLVEKRAQAPREAIREMKRMNRLAERMRMNPNAG